MMYLLLTYRMSSLMMVILLLSVMFFYYIVLKPAIICEPIKHCQYDRFDQYAVSRMVHANTETVCSCKEVYHVIQFESIFVVQLKLLIFLHDFPFLPVRYVQTAEA